MLSQEITTKGLIEESRNKDRSIKENSCTAERSKEYFSESDIHYHYNPLQGRNFSRGRNCFRNSRLHCNQTLIQSWNSPHCNRTAVYKVTRCNATFIQETSSEELTSISRNINRSTKKKHSTTTTCRSKHFSESDPILLPFYSKFSINSSPLKFLLLCQYNSEFYSIFILKYSNILFIQTKIYKCIVNHDITLPPLTHCTVVNTQLFYLVSFFFKVRNFFRVRNIFRDRNFFRDRNLLIDRNSI